ncbi:MAG: DNA gyrase subunit A [Clostridia bacterium]|jgi:DNA gyrase subunit A|nr:DNA gyrase subunit A [Clostridia bacterium]
MKKRERSGVHEEIIDNTKIVRVQVEEEMKKSFIAYAMAVNVSRAIPDVRDGLKPVHRRILYAMGDLNLSNDKPYKKCARIVGDVIGKYHPHGDTAVYDALVRLAQDFSINCPLVDGHGNFGSVDGDPPAAMRYTEARLSKIAGEMLRDIEKETIDYYPNYDDTLMQPTILPSRFPNLLVNGSDGIAVGMATNIPPHNLNEVINGVMALIDNPEITIEELMKYIPAPDFPTGGIIMGSAAIRQAYLTGHGGIVVRAKIEIEESEGGNSRARIIVTELPYQVNKAKLIMAIADLVKDKRIEGISDIKEESDRKGMRLVFDLKKDANPQVVLNTLYKHSELQTKSGITFLSLVNGVPKILNLYEMLYYYLEHQKGVIVRRTRFDLNKAEERAHIVEGLVKALGQIDAVIKTIKASKERADAIENLVNGFELTEKQAIAILEMRLQRLTGLEIEKLNEEYAILLKTIEELKIILNSDQKVLDIIKTELIEIQAKYGTPRKTEISVDYSDINIEDLIDKEDVVVTMTHFGYIKRISVTEYKSQHRGGKGVTAHKPKEEDFVEQVYITSTHDTLLFFSSFGKVYAIKGYEVPEGERQARGRAMINVLPLASGEKISAMIPMNENSRGYIIMATKRGLIKKTDLSEFAEIRKNGKIAIRLLDSDELIGVQFTAGQDNIIMASHEGKCIRFSEKNVRKMGRDTQGVRSMKLNPNDYIVDMLVLNEDCEILTVSENGYGKRSDPEDYREQGRAGKGVKAGIFNEKTGMLVNLKQVRPEEDIMLIADNGIIIRVNADDISKVGRNTQGVRIMRIGDTAKVVCVAITAREEEPVEIESQTETINSEENFTEPSNEQV